MLQPEREMRRHKAWIMRRKEPQLFAKCDTQVFRGPGPQMPFSESCLLDLVRHRVCQETGLLQD